MRGARRPIHEERLVGRECAMALRPGNRLIRKVLAQMIFRIVRRLDGIEVLIEPGFPLRCLARQKAIEIVEADALAGRPSRERPHGRCFGRGRVVPFAEGGGLVSIFAEHFGERRRCSRDHAGVAVPIHGALGDGSRPDALMVASREQRRPRRRTNRCGVEGVVADPLIGDARQGRRMNRTAIGVGEPKAHIIQEDDENIGRVLWQMALLHASAMDGILQSWFGHARRRRRCEGQDGSIVRTGGRLAWQYRRGQNEPEEALRNKPKCRLP
jgi:hypothetical protein